MKTPISILLLLLLIHISFAQDFNHTLEGIDKVKISAETTIIVKSHAKANFLISNSENKNVSDKSNGLKPIFNQGKDNTGFNINVEKNGSVLKVISFQSRLEDDLIIYLPIDMNLSAEVLTNNDVFISNFTSEIEAKTYNGDIIIKNVAGPIVVENTNGNVTVIFDEVNQNSPISIVDSNGDIDISIPEITKANLNISVPRGELFTDFNLEPFKNKSEESTVRKTRTIKTKLNNGGVNISILASKGNVYLRQL